MIVVLFLDVDGVLNRNWHGADVSGFHSLALLAESPSNDGIEADLLANLGTLCHDIRESGKVPRVVVSSTWRLEAHLTARLLTALTGQGIALYGDVCEEADTEWCTPDLGDRRSSEGRVAEIRAWLLARPEQETWLALDDLDLLWSENGRVNQGMCEECFVHTADRGGQVGLTEDKVAAAMTKLRQQERRAEREAGTGDFTPAEWAVLMKSAVFAQHSATLCRNRCPFWIKSQAREYILQQQARPDTDAGCACHCLIS